MAWMAGLVLASAACVADAQPPAGAVAPAAVAQHGLIVGNLAGETTTISPQEIAALPHTQIESKAPHSDQTVAYEGVPLKRVLEQGGVRPLDPAKPESKEIARSLRSAYLLIEAFDGYQAVFSLPEVFGEPGDKLLLADRASGKPLEAKAAPFQLVVAGSGTHERWVRQVRRVLVRPASASPFPSQPAPASAAQAGARGGLYLVGTGPGAPDLITVRATEILRKADLVLCYSWMKDELAPFVRPGVVEVASPLLQGGRYFGQKPEDFTGEQRDRALAAHEELRKLKARIQGFLAEGKTVAFADNGDPMVFSPWSWVPEHLADLKPVVVPGLSSFNAGNAALQRSVASLGSVVISAGADLGVADPKGRLAGTVVFFTHREKLEHLLPKLRSRYPDDTPVGVVCDVSYPTEKVIHATLGTLEDALGAKKLPHLYLLYVGDGLKQGATCR